MHTIERRLVILAGMLFAVLNADSGLVPVKKMTVSDLMLSNTLSKKSGLVDYFKELELDHQCNTPILNVSEFKILVNDNNIAPCLCTVIYNMTQELNTILENVSETAKTHFNSSQSSNLAVYEIWKNVSTKSSSLKLFMEPLKDEEKWKIVCHSIEDNVLTRYCKFLNFEVMTWHNIMSKPNEPTIENIVKNNVPKNLEPVIPSVESVIPIEPSIPGGNEIDAGADDPSKLNDFNNIDEEPAVGINIKEDETTIEDIQDKPIESKDELSPTKLKDNSKSNNDYPNPEDGNLVDSEAKEAQSRFSQTNTFNNHEFGDVEDSHFLFYFGLMTVFSLLFYLALYNKKKIIALLIEGRRSTNHRRRPNTASYSKVETDDGTTVF